MIIVDSKEFFANMDKYFDLAKTELVIFESEGRYYELRFLEELPENE